MDDKNSKKKGKDLPMIETAYKEITALFNVEKTTFEERRASIPEALITQIFWSSAYIDFFPNESLLDQLKPAKIYSKEKRGTIKNLCDNNGLFFACHNDNEKWGCLFIEQCNQVKKSLFFVENDQEEMELRRLRLAYMEGEKYNRVLSYTFNSDECEETLIIDSFQYGDYGISQIVRSGFWEDYANILPVRSYHFTSCGNMSITIT